MEATGREALICARRVRKEYEDLMHDPLPNVLVALTPDDHLNWYCLIHGLTEEYYLGGEYLFQIRLSPRYPFEPPDFYIHTPNGRFELNKKLCFSNSSLHAESWSPMWTVRKMILGFLSFFLETKSKGYGHMESTSEEKKAFADKSKKYNDDNHATLLAMIYQQNGITI